MRIHLPSLPVAVSTVPWETIRQHELQLQLKSAGFKHVVFHEGARTAPHWKGVNRNLLRILESHRAPFLLLEDDARFLPAYRPTIDVHPEALVTYLGGTRHGNPLDGVGSPMVGLAQSRLPGAKPHLATWHAPFDADHVRVFNMHSCHAVLFHNETGLREFHRRLAVAIDVKAADMLFADCHRDALVLLRNPSFWYQDDARNVHLTSSIV
jgi:hypothetical protein